MSYSAIYKDCHKCPVSEYCLTIWGNTKVICSTMPSPEELEEQWQKLIDIQ